MARFRAKSGGTVGQYHHTPKMGFDALSFIKRGGIQMPDLIEDASTLIIDAQRVEETDKTPGVDDGEQPPQPAPRFEDD